MKTEIKKTGDTIIVKMDGVLDFETHAPLKENLTDLIQQAKTDSIPTRIIFNFEKLEFVGSSGISSFVHLLKEFNARAPSKPRYCHVKSEFRKIIQAFDEDELFEFYENEERAQKGLSQ